MTRVAAVLWSGEIGGAETYTADLVHAMRGLDADVGIVFVTHGEPLVERLRTNGIPHIALGLPTGKHVAWRWRTFTSAVRRLGPDGVILPSPGLLAAALRIGGYRRQIVVVAHDATAGLGDRTMREALVRPLDLAAGYWAADVDVAVSQFVLSETRRRMHSSSRLCIYNGIDLDAYAPVHREPRADIAVGYVGRLVDGKGVDVLLAAFARSLARGGHRLFVAGDGPARAALERQAADLGLFSSVEFRGWVPDVAAFWADCDVAVVPSDGCVESFGMAAVEAMACGRPVVVSATGALPELVVDRVAGLVVQPGDEGQLGAALRTLAADADLRTRLGEAARRRCEEMFDIRLAARAYLALFRAS